MAIVSSAEQDESTTQMILVVVRHQGSEQPQLEKQMRRAGFSILQQKTIELEEDQVNKWLLPLEDEGKLSEIKYVGYALQRKNASTAWSNFAEDTGREICGIVEDSDYQLKNHFPSVVTEEYLLQPEVTEKYLSELKPTIMDGLKQLCEDQPDDPVSYLAKLLEQSQNR